MTIYSTHTVNDGRWQVVLHIKESDDFVYRYDSRPDIRALVDQNYNERPETIAKILLEQVLDCASVQVNMLCGPGVYMEKK
jgi:hypothetical protein